MRHCWIVAGLLAGATAWAAPRKGPNYEAFWLRPPQQDMDTVLLWQLDNEELGHKEDAIELLEQDINKIGTSSTVLDQEIIRPDRQELIGCSRQGDAALDPAGRFQGCVRFAGQGWLQSQYVNLFSVTGDGGGSTLDFWVKPDRAARDAVVLSLSKRVNPEAVTLERRGDGQLVVQVGNEVLLTHSRKLPADEWTHVALVASRSLTLLVNGTPTGLAPDGIKTWSRIFTDGLRGFNLGGGDVAGKGLVGRVDAVRVSRGVRLLYQQEDPAWYDVPARRTLERNPPYFVFNRPPNLVCSFDGSLAPTESAAGVTGSGSAKPDLFQPGVRGQALDLRRVGEAGFAVTGTNVFPVERGSLEFWVQPVDWDNFYSSRVGPQDVPWLPVLRVGPPGGKGGRSLAISQGKFSLLQSVTDSAIPFHPGKWTHVLYVWNGSTASIYLDGRAQPLAQVRVAGDPAPVGAENVLTFLPSATLVDELRVYPWPMTGTEAQNAYARFYADSKERLIAMPFLDVAPGYDYYGQYLRVGVSCLPVDNVEPTTVDVRIYPAEGQPPFLVATNVALNAALQAWPGMVTNLPFGKYPVEAVSRAADGRVLKTLKTTYERVRPAWWQNDLGKNLGVPKPWTPIQVAGTTLQVWDRKVGLGPGGLPVSLTSSNTEMFASAPRLHGTIAGGAAVFAGDAAPVIAAAPDRTDWTGTLRTKDVTAHVKAWLEYDGLMYYTVTLQPVAGATEIQSLSLDFLFPPELATQLIVNGGGHQFRASWNAQMLPPNDGQLWNSRSGRPGHKGVAFGNFCPVVWIGNDERGLCFYGENDKGWTPNGEQPAQEVIREAGQVIYRMNIINQPVQLTGTREFTFVLHPTPTKPLPPGWRGYNRGGYNGQNAVYDAIDAFVSPTLTVPSTQSSHEGINFKMEPTDWESARINADSIRGRFGKSNPVFFYMDYSWPNLGPSMDEYRSGLFWTGRLTWSREVEDYMVWIVNEYIRRGIIDGIYIDDVSMGSTRALYSTAYEIEPGKVQPGFNTLGFRRFLQRVWVLLDQQGKQPHILPHMTYCFEIPAFSFSSAVVNGEDRDIHAFAQHSFIEVWSRDELRIMSSSPKWGFINFWKPGLYTKGVAASAKAKVPAWMHWQSRAMHALTVPNDMWYLWLYPTSRTIDGALIKFGMADPDVRFIPYWNLGDAASASGQSLMLSLYAKKNRALVIVSNPRKEEQEVTVKIDPAKLFGTTPDGVVTWKDVDFSLIPPESGVATAQDLKNVKVEELGFDDLLSDGKRQLTEEGVKDFLQGDSPTEKLQKHLALRVNGNSVTFRLRGRDYRLLEVSLP